MRQTNTMHLSPQITSRQFFAFFFSLSHRLNTNTFLLIHTPSSYNKTPTSPLSSFLLFSSLHNFSSAFNKTLLSNKQEEKQEGVWGIGFQNLCVLFSCHVGCRRQKGHLLCVCGADARGVAYVPHVPG